MIPLTVIGGFLGAGKTTLVNHLLRAAPVRFGVLANDFGAIGIDAALIAERSGETIALTNGCVCCQMDGDLGAGLARLAERGVEHVLVEASGVGDPWRIAQLALVEPGFDLEPIVVLADARAIAGHLRDKWVADTVLGQLQAAEVVVLNKAEASPALDEARATIRRIRPAVPVVETVQSAVPTAALRFSPPPRGRFRADRPPEHSFQTWRVAPPGPFDRVRLRAVLRALPPSVLRVKGFCELGPQAEPHLLQFAAGQWALSPFAPTAPGLVVIGTPDMPDAALLDASFASACL